MDSVIGLSACWHSGLSHLSMQEPCEVVGTAKKIPGRLSGYRYSPSIQ